MTRLGELKVCLASSIAYIPIPLCRDSLFDVLLVENNSSVSMKAVVAFS